ncbi:MAG: response regulator [Acidobacteria bacterium]|nr:response regulator [Acidobacteriota bacterium]
MTWNTHSRIWRWLAIPLAVLSIILTLSLLDNNQRQTMLIVTCCMLGLVPVVLFQVYRNDILERDKAKAELREMELRYSRFLELTPTPIAHCRKGRIVDVNRAWEKLVGAASPVECLNRKMNDFLDLANRDWVERHLEEAARLRREVTILDQTIVATDGSKIPVEMLVIPGEDIKDGAVRVLVRDISDRKRADEAVANADREIVAARNAKTEFLAHVSHEIRTPMNAIVGMSGLLLDTPLTDKQLQYLHAVRRSADQLLAMFNDVLDLAKLDAGQLPLEPAPFDLESVLEETLEWMRPSLHLRPVELSLIYGTSVPRGIVGDAGRIRQIAVHLVHNAIKYTERGRILMAVEEESRTAEGVLVRVSVSDTGTGISDDMLRKLFQPFTQGDSSTTRKHGGMGIGLVLCRKLVESMNGQVGVVSKEGLGSTFHFRLPLPLAPATFEANKERRTAVPLTADQDVFPGRRILLVEDNPINQKLGVALLERFGARVDTAGNGREAVQMADRLPYDAIFMDCQMPVMDGYDATREIRRRESGRPRTPIVAMTAHAFHGDKEKCSTAGMDDYISKPVNVDEIRNFLLAVSAHRGPEVAVSRPVTSGSDGNGR